MNNKNALIIKYYLEFGDKTPSELGVRPDSCYCPICKGSGEIFQQSSDGRDDRWIICKTCKGFGVFDHKPKPITRVVRYE